MSVYDDWDDPTAEESILLSLSILIVSRGKSVNENNKIVTIGIRYIIYICIPETNEFRAPFLIQV